MRLIDADKLPATCTLTAVNGHLELSGWFAAERITEAPTIEAIPVEWIAQWLLKNCYDGNGHYIGEGYDTVEDMLAYQYQEGE